MLFLVLFLTSPEVFVYEVPNNILLSYVSTHFTISKKKHILDPKQACIFIHMFSNFEKI